MLLRQFCLGSNLSMHIRTNTDFLWQKPWQLPSVEANFEDWKVGGGGDAHYYQSQLCRLTD